MWPLCEPEESALFDIATTDEIAKLLLILIFAYL